MNRGTMRTVGSGLVIVALIVGWLLLQRGYVSGDPVFNRSMSRCKGDIVAALKDCGTTRLDQNGNIIALILDRRIRRGSPGRPLPDLRHNNAVLAFVREVPTIRSLGISPLTDIDDGGMSEIGQMEQLEQLNLNGVPVTDAGLETLHSLNNLKRINLYATKVTEQGAVAFMNAVPGCAVYWGSTLDPNNPVRKTWDRNPARQP